MPLTLFFNLGYENGDVGGLGAATGWALDSLASVETIAAYFGNGGNLQSKSDELSDPAWTVTGGGSIATNEIVLGPPGLNATPWELTDGVGLAAHGVTITTLGIPGIPTPHAVVLSCWFRKPAGGPNDFVLLNWNNESKAWLDLDTGIVSQQNLGAEESATIEDYGDGWYRCTVRGQRSGAFSITITSQAVAGDETYVGTGVAVLQLYGVQANIGTTVTPYIVTGGIELGQLPFESFESLWDRNESYFFDFDDILTIVALYDTTAVGTKAFESFEELWDSNEGYDFALPPVTAANYTAIGAEVETFDVAWPESKATDVTSDHDNNALISASGWVQDERIIFQSADNALKTLPSPLAFDTVYWVLNTNASQTTIATTMGGSIIDTTDNGTGSPFTVTFVDRATYFFDLATAGATAAPYDGEVGAATEDFEDFEDEWGLGLFELADANNGLNEFIFTAPLPKRVHLLDEPVEFENIGGQTLPAGFSFNTTYYVRGAAGTDARSQGVQLGATPGGGVITFVDDGTGGPFKLKALGGNFHYITAFTNSTDIDAASYDTTFDLFEDFEEEWPTVTMVTV
jgi:hypothetical protein